MVKQQRISVSLKIAKYTLLDRLNNFKQKQIKNKIFYPDTFL